MENPGDLVAGAGEIDEAEARRKGIGLIDGSFSGYVLWMGGEFDQRMLENLRRRKILVFAAGEALQVKMLESGSAFGWDRGILGYDIKKALGFLYRVAKIFSGMETRAEILAYAHQRLPGFCLLLGEPSPEELSGAEAALELGAPLFSTGTLPATVENRTVEAKYPAAVSQLSVDEIVQVGIEGRGLAIRFPTPELPVAYGEDLTGQIVRDDACGVCLAGVELTTIGENIVDGLVRVVGPDLGAGLPGTQSYGVLVEVSGREMQPDFEPVLERQIDVVFNRLDGVMHRGQRSMATVRVSKRTIEQGFSLRHLGELLHAHYHNEYGSILSRVQVTVFTEPGAVEQLNQKAQAVFRHRDERLAALSDEAVETFYTCTICQSISSTHICVISPEHPGVCGAVDWMDARAGSNIRPIGPNKAVGKEGLIDARLGQWESVNRLVQQETGGAFDSFNLYSLMEDPSTACGDFECITALLPMCDGVMIVGRDYQGMTPSGMDWGMLYDIVGTGERVPGFLGHSKRALHRDKHISAEGGWQRIVWMNHTLREELRPVLDALAEKAGISGFVDMIATEKDALSEVDILERLASNGHPIVAMEPML